ncbi:MAG: hypothetical protein ACE5OR_15350, partial [bacterium]
VKRWCRKSLLGTPRSLLAIVKSETTSCSPFETAFCVQTDPTATKTTGFHETYWEGTDNTGKRVASGIYWYKLSTTGFSTARKMLLLR